jgi:hypothetical protein
MPGTEDVTTTESSTVEAVVEKPVETPEAPKTPENAIPYARFKEVNDAKKQYERFGPPDKIETDLNELAYYREVKRQVEEESKTSKDGTPTPETAMELENAKTALHRIEPRLAKAIEAGDDYEINRMARVVVAEEATREILKSMGEDDSQENMEALAESLKPFIMKKRLIRAMYQLNPEKAVQLAHKAWKEKVITPTIERQMRAKQEEDKTNLNKLPKAHAPTGSPPTGKATTEIRTMADAERSVKAKMARGLEV